MKFKFAVFTLNLLMVLTMATGAFAQATFQVSSSSEQRGRMNGHAEKAGDISLAWVSGGFVTADDEGTVVINYGVPVTNKVGGPLTPLDSNIMVTICKDGLRETDDSAVKVSKNTITITVDEDCDVSRTTQSTLMAFCSHLWGRASTA